MGDVDPIQRQRGLLSAFRRISSRRALAEAEADGTRKADHDEADREISQSGQAARHQLNDARQALAQIQPELTEAGLGHMLTGSPWSEPSAGWGADPAVELTRSVSACQAAREGTHTTVQSFIQWQEGHRKRRRDRTMLAVVAVSLFVVVSVPTAIAVSLRLVSAQETETLYKSALGAIEAGEWEQAGDLIMQLQRDAPDYKDTRELIDSHPQLRRQLWLTGHVAHLGTLEKHEYGVKSVAFSPDGAMLVSGSDDGTAKIWDVGNQRELLTLLPQLCEIISVAWSPDGSTVALGDWCGNLTLWDPASGQKVVETVGHDYMVFDLDFSPDSTILASGGRDGTVRLWSVSTGQALATIEGFWVNSVAFSPDGATLASAHSTYGEETVNLRDVSGGTGWRTLQFSSCVSSLAFSPEGSMLATGHCSGTVDLWEVSTGQNLRTLGSDDLEKVNSVAFYPDGAILAAGHDDSQTNLWEVSSGSRIVTLLGHCSGVSSVAFSPDGRVLATGCDDGTVMLWGVPVMLWGVQ